MAATKQDLERWYYEGKEQNATHMIIVCDTFDYEDYPVYVMPTESVDKKISECMNREMSKVIEVYNLRITWKAQSTGRVWNR